MKTSPDLRQKLRIALLSTTGLCVASLMFPGVATAVPLIERVSGGQVVDANTYTFEHDVIVENAGSRLRGTNIRVRDGAQMTIDDGAEARFDYLAIGMNATGGRVRVSNGGALYVATNVVTGEAQNGGGHVTVEGAGSRIDVGGDLVVNAFGQQTAFIEIIDGGSLNVAGSIVLTSGTGGDFGRSNIYIGSSDWTSLKAPGQLTADRIVSTSQSGVHFYHNGYFEYAGELVGEGYLSVRAGHNVLSGDSSGFDGIIYSDHELGILEVNGRLGGIYYLGNGHLTGTGTVDVVQLGAVSSAIIRPEETTPTIGTLDIGPVSVLYVAVDPVTGKSGTLRVAGKATIGEEAALHHIAGTNNDFRRAASFVIIDAAGGVEGQFDTLASNFAFLDMSVDYTATQVIMNLTRNDIRFVDIAQTANQRAVAGAIEGIDADMTLSDLVIDLNDQNARLGFTQMAGELHASARSAMMLDAANLRHTVIGSVAGNTTSGQGYTAWGRVLSSASKLDGQGENTELKADATGFVAGVDKAFGEAIRAGVMVGVETAEMKSVGLGQIDRDTQHLGVYGRGDWGRFNVQAGAIASWHSLSSERDLAFGNVAQRLKGDYDATSQQAYVEAAYAVPMAWATVSPYASLAFNTLDVDAVTEKGGVAALEIAENAQDLTTAGLGIVADKRWTVANGRAASLSARVGWESYSGDLDAIQTAAFADSAEFSIVGLPMGDEAVVASVSVAMPVGKAGRVALDWSGAKGSDHDRNSVALSYRLSF